ncbi:modifier of mdg4-like isoform X2 [Lucilia sericata]|uniref:modifier of mdg4-like isoform X2 n=1 Tax=Lucilia sericata TaxID=13632 RepID=UPI0018A85E45|nr:modifier of mdg4-like isoform X2 [Lucilia sericata]
MADDEQFSLCWNNFNSNLSAGFHESLCRGDLVDVTLAAEGQFVKAHRLVLSVCSPYFRKMFTQMPANQHAFVFLKDVSHTALKDLIQFMYCGEVNVKQEALPAFISTAEALQIKGLTDSDPPQSQTPPEPSTPTPQIQQQQQIQTSPRVRQRTSTARSYKIETVEDSGDDAKQTTQIVIQTTAPTHPPQATITTQPQHQQQHQPQQQQQQHHHQPQQQQHITQQTLHTQTHQLTSVSMPAATTTTVVTQKRPAQRSSLGSVPNIKRSKSTIDPLEASDANTAAATHQINVQTVVAESKPQVQHHHQQQQQHQTHHHHQQQQAQHQQQTNEPEYIDLPIDLPTKSEPDYAEEAGEVDQAEQDATYVEDESYGDMRYDESYFTENEDAAAAGGNATATSTQNTSATTATTSKAIVKQQPLSDSSYMDTSADPANSDAQENAFYDQVVIQAQVQVLDGLVAEEAETSATSCVQRLSSASLRNSNNGPVFVVSKYGTKQLLLKQHTFNRHVTREDVTYWRCSQFAVLRCRARIKTKGNILTVLNSEHNHEVITQARKYGSLKTLKAEQNAKKDPKEKLDIKEEIKQSDQLPV